MIKWIDTQLAECNCNLCGIGNHEAIFRRPDGLQVVQCKSCGLVYLNPRPKDDLIPILYDNDYFMSPSSIGFDNYFSDETRIGMRNASKMRLRVLREAGIKSFAKMIEVGCGTGEFCHVVHNMGVSVTGIDISESAITEAISRYKAIPFHVGTIEDVDPEVKYDALFAFEVIEHLANPDRFFAKASVLLEQNGIFCITTPSFECGESIGFDNWIGFSTSFEHLYFFSAATVAKFAEKHGMGVVCTLYGGGRGLSGAKSKENNRRLAVKKMLNSLHLLHSLRKLKKKILPVKNIYQSKKPLHNLFIVLRKNT